LVKDGHAYEISIKKPEEFLDEFSKHPDMPLHDYIKGLLKINWNGALLKKSLG